MYASYSIVRYADDRPIKLLGCTISHQGTLRFSRSSVSPVFVTGPSMAQASVHPPEVCTQCFKSLWRDSCTIGWALYYKRMSSSTPVLLSATQALRILLNQNIILDMASPSPMSDWPEHMYIDKNGKGDICCPAMGCQERFKTDEGTQLKLVEHYKDAVAKREDGDRIQTHIHHRILKQMYKLQRCLVCRTDFKLPNSELPDSRALFKHNRKEHAGEKDVSTIQGFIIHVRKFPHNFAVKTPEEIKYWSKTLAFAFRYLEWSLKSGPEPLLFDFQSVMSDRQAQIPEDKLRELLTFDTTEYLIVHPEQAHILNQTKYYPYDPEVFLRDVQYYPFTTPLNWENWFAARTKLQGYYREGRI